MTNIYLSQKNFSRTGDRVTFGDVHYEPGGFCGPRLQRDYQLVAIYSGEAHVEVQEEERHVPAQHITLMLPQRRELFRFAATRPTHHGWCAITPEALPEPLRARLDRLPACLPLSQRMRDLIQLGLSVPPGEIPAADALLESVALALFQAYLFDAEYADQMRHVPDAVRQAQRFIDAHLAEPLQLPQIAHAASVTPQHLTRLFRRQLNTTPIRYLWQQRTRRGVELLRETGLSVSEVAERVGFQSPFHFSRLVRQEYQLPPRALRERLWGGIED
jgi:AraC family transcriptional regulator of arabinose operon